MLNICNDVQPAKSLKVVVANDKVMTPNAKAILPLPPQLTLKAKTAFAFDEIKSRTLIPSDNYVTIIV